MQPVRMNKKPRIESLVTFAVVVLSLLCTSGESLTAKDEVSPNKEVTPAKASEWKSLFDGKSLKNWKKTEFGGEGDVEVKDGMIVMQQGSELSGITWNGGDIPKINYEISLMAQRIDGSDFFCGLTFPVKDDPCSLIIGGWGGGIVGISSLDGLDAANNETSRFESFKKGRWYKIRMRVTEKGLMAWVDDKQMIGVETKGRKISIRYEVDLSRPLGIACYSTVAGLKDIKIRELSKQEAEAEITPAEPTDDKK